jgi:nucleoside-diphosphate-sugar epimerase
VSLKIFIPGGAGYIGSILSEELLNLGYKVTVLDNFYYQQSSLLHLMRNKNFNLVKGDFCDHSLVNALAAKADVIIPLAALVGAPLCDREPALSVKVNVEAPLQLFKNISSQQMLLMPTTNSAYGSGGANNLCDENSALNPISTYAKMKLEVENALLQKENSISFRLATVFGVSPRMRLDLLVNDFTYRAVKNKKLSVFEGHYKRNYIHIKDVAQVFIHGINNFSKMKHQIYNVGLSSANISKLELCALIKKQVTDLEYFEDSSAKDPDQRNYIVSNKKIEATGFSPRYTLDDGIQEVIRSYPLFTEQKMKNV